MFSDKRASELMDQVMELVCPTFFDACGTFQCSGCWPSGKDAAWFEIQVYPSVVELVGGKEDGETVYQGFRVDLKALQEAVFPLYTKVPGVGAGQRHRTGRRPAQAGHHDLREVQRQRRQHVDHSHLLVSAC